MPEIRFCITQKLNSLISKAANELGVVKSDYVKMLILQELKNGK